MNVLHLISSGGYYGAENVVVSLAESLENKNCRNVIGIFHSERQRNEELVRQAERRGLTVLRMECRGRCDWRTVQTIREKLESLHVDLVHTHGYKPDLYGFLASRNLERPRVATCHLWTHDTAAVRLYEFVDAMFLRKFDAVVAVSETIAERLVRAGIPPAKVRVIDNGIDLVSFSRTRAADEEENRRDRSLVVGTVGRLVPQKGLEYFLCAAREVLAEFPNVIFRVVGAGADREKLEGRTRELGIQEKVVFTGHCADMPGAYASMDVFVLASVDEGMPMAVLEALASRTAVVATSVGAVPRLVLAGETGLLVPPKDVPALRNAILKLLNDPALRTRLGNAGEALIRRNHSRDLMARNYLQLYEQLAHPRAVHAPHPRRTQEKQIRSSLTYDR